ncbi:MAG: hypothetical protein JWO74_4839, partial [Solirubrobacterales bacterium]|nr:hypothetical protein [Solirubrobacterales bacterium]
PELDLRGAAGMLALGRARLAHRAIALASGPAELATQLAACERGEAADGLLRGVARREPRVGFVFPGQGGQWPRMALDLIEQSPVFAQRMEACARAIAPHVDFDLMGVLRAEPGQPTLDPIEVVQPALFAMMVSLAALWRSFGVEPAAVVGHSQGEIAAAHVAGGLTLEDAARIVCVRSRSLAAIDGGGGMMAVSLSPGEFAERARTWAGRVGIAAVNGPTSLVVSGDPEALDELLAALEADGVWARPIAVTYAAHSSHVEVARAELLSALASVEPRQNDIPLYSTVTGGLTTTATMGAEYWYRNLRETVQFDPAVRALAGADIDVLIEIGPHPVLTAPALEILESERDPRAVAALGTLHRDDGGLDRFVAALSEAHVRGVPVDWEPLLAGAERVELPTYAFQRSHYWLPAGAGRQYAGALGQAAAEHPLLGAMVHVAGGGGLLFTGRLSLESQPWLADHAVLGTVLVPGTVFLELALHAAAQTDTPVVAELTLAAPLPLADDGAVALQVTVSDADDEGRRRIAIYSRVDGGAADWTEHASGSLVADDQAAQRPGPWPAGGEDVDPEDAYARLAEGGYEYGPAFQGLRRLVRAGDALHAEVALAEDEQARAEDYGIHPALLDAALHPPMLAGLDDGSAGGTEIPFSFQGVRALRRGAAALRVAVTDGPGSWRIVAADADGAPVVSIDAMQTRRLDPNRLAAQRGGNDALFAVRWTPLPAAPAPPAGAVAVLGEDLPVEAAADLPVARYADLQALADAIAAGADAPGSVLVGVEPDDGPLPEAAHVVTERVLELLKQWLATDALAGSRLIFVTCRALAVADRERPDLRQAPVPGLLRSAHSEHPDRVALIDRDGSALTSTALLTALGSGEPEVAVREDAVLVPRLQRFRGDDTLTPPDDEDRWCVSVGATGTLEGLRLARHPRADDPLARGEVRVAVHAAGINFRDVWVTLGMLDDPEIGSEGAGVVTEVGAGVVDLAPGDRVMGVIPHAFGPMAVADRRGLVRIPDGWSFSQAASVPLVFLTAYYGLVDLADMKAGDAVLVHGAAGGVGMAAVQIARYLGAEVFATAHPRKWETLRGLGIDDDHIASSRTADFEEAFLRATDGRGLDVVLDSLAGPLVDASLRLLPRGGRFVEMGKSDIRDPATVAEQHPGVAYRWFDLLETPPERIGAMLAEIVGLFEQAAFEPLPISTWDVRRAPEAFRVLRDSGHVGKLVLRVPQPLREDGTVLVTGGTGGLGALVARHLVQRHGARRLLLVSRRGPAADGARELATELRELGCEADVAACDVSDRAALQRLLADIPAEHPLTAVVHAAGVLDDGVVTALDGERLRRVMTPKLDAALHLHELTRELELSEFIVFSSAAAAVGSPGQANYAAANAFLDALAAVRRAEGLPALSLAFGVWARVTGMVEHLATADGMRAGPMDMLPLPDDLGLELIDRARQADEPLLVPMLLDLGKLRGRARSGVLPPIFSGLVRAPGRAAGGTTSFARMVAGAPAADRERIVLDVVRTHAAAVLGHATPEAIPEDRPFKELGFDSLSAVELRNRIAAATGLTLPATLVFDHPTPAAVGRLLRDRIEEREVEAVATASTGSTALTDDPIVIVGLGCRYPGGVGSADDLWDLVASGGDAIGEFPSDRGWDVERLVDLGRTRTGTSYVRHGGFVDATEFDAEHFSISPREALAMDPQQRLLLECAWEVLEDAGIDPSSLRGSDTGVFVGAYASDYGVGVDPPEEVLGLRLTGSVTSVISGRVAYTLGLEGPAMTIDTACSSSLVSLHLAAQALRQGECSLALAGGVCVLATPTAFVEFSRQGGLAPDGRCRAFGAEAAGTGFSEGAGLVALERLSVARERGHRVLAVVRGSATNQDGASNGLSAPSGPAQERVIRQALANAGLEPDDVDAVEAHGTGTALGDPIEAGALIATYGRRSNGPLWLGSLKSNIGHTQTAAGVGGIIKMVMAMRHELLPQTLHAEEPSPHVAWDDGAVRLLSEPVPWPRGARPRRAGVSSFGISGTNAHVVLEEAPAQETAPVASAPGVRPGMLPFLVSGSSAAALAAQARRLRTFVEAGAELDPLGVATSLARDRAQLLHRAVALAPSLGDLAPQLRALERGAEMDGLLRGVGRRAGRIAFVFPGQGGQWPGMAAELLEQSPVFAERMEACAAALAPHVTFDLLGVVRRAAGQPTLDPIEVVQPVLFAIMVSLAELWRSFGVTPAAVVGHSQGEIAAAHIAGGLTLEDAARIVAVRSRALSEIEGGGGMLAVAMPPGDFAERTRDLDGRVTVAAVNGPASLVVSGDPAALDELHGALEAERVWTRRIASTVAGHSPHVEVAHDAMLSALASVAPRPNDIPLYSTVSGGLATTAAMGAEHWYRNLRQTVEFASALRAMAQDGVRTLIEVSPHPVLTTSAYETIEAAGVDGSSVAVMGSLRRDDGGLDRFAGALAEAHVAGVDIDWTALFGAGPNPGVPVPTYAFQRRRFWLGQSRGGGDASALGQAAAEHPLLDAVVELAGGQGTVFTGRLSLERHGWLADHVVSGGTVVPETAFLELALHAGAHTGVPVVAEMSLGAPLRLDDGGGVALQVTVSAPGEDGRRPLTIHSRPEGADADEWVLHASATLAADVPAGPGAEVATIPGDAIELDLGALYDSLEHHGYEYGPAFLGLTRAWRDGSAIVAELELPDDEAERGAAFRLHPALADAALQPALLLAGERLGDAPVAVAAWSDVWVSAPGPVAARAHVRLEDDGTAVVLSLADQAGRPVVALRATLTAAAGRA